MYNNVSVVIPCYNCAHMVRDAIDSVLTQTVQPLEIIVVDDGSTDQLDAALFTYVGRIRVIRLENGGLPVARNAGIRASRGDLIAFLDADDKWLPNKLELQLRYLSEHPEVGIIHSDLLVWTPSTGELAHIPKGRELYAGNCYRQFFWQSRVMPSTVIAKKRILEKVGLFDESIKTCEDLDLWIRISRIAPFGYVPEPLIHYRIHDGGITHNAARMAEGHLSVYSKAVRAGPRVFSLIEAWRKLGAFASEAAYWHFDSGAMKEARKYALTAMRYGSIEGFKVFVASFILSR